MPSTIPVYDENREKKVVENCISNLENKSYSNMIKIIYKQIMDACKKIEE